MTPPANQDGHHGQTWFKIGPYVKFIKKSSGLELLAELESNSAEIVLKWSSFRILSNDPTHRKPRWLHSALDPMGRSLKNHLA